ncbi:MAG: hypothetical protein WD315_03185 [Balneolaceae bacterium]
MNRHFYLVLLPLFLLVFSCSRSETELSRYQTHIHGHITVSTDLDTIRDYSGFQLLISRFQGPGEHRDTLYYAVTDEDGHYHGDATFTTPGLYTMLVMRRGEELAWTDMVLAENDTIQFEAEFPDVERTATIQSSENDLYRSYLRLQSGVNRLFQFAGAGQVSGDTLQTEIRKWSDLHWDFHQENPHTFAGRQSAASSIRLLQGLDTDLMLQRLDHAVEEDPLFIPFASIAGVRHYAEQQGLDRALTYIDSLSARDPGERIRMQLQMNRVKLLYDSARVAVAREELEEFRNHYSGITEADSWIERFEYDLTKLAPGSELPDFKITSTDGREVSRESKRGAPYILEFTRLDNLLYQEQFDRNIAIHHIYKNYGIDFVTIPFGANNVMMEAFFEERARLWSFAEPGSFEPDKLIERFNINVVPTRILVDRHGNVVRKYEGTEYNDIIRGLQAVLRENQTEEPS